MFISSTEPVYLLHGGYLFFWCIRQINVLGLLSFLFGTVFLPISALLDESLLPLGRGHRVVGNIWCISAGSPSSRPYRMLTLASPFKAD